MVPNSSATGNFIENRLGLLFHSDSAHVRGILERMAPSTQAATNGVVIPALSNNDTNTNPTTRCMASRWPAPRASC